MIEIAYYLLKVVCCSGLLFLYYHLVLRNKIFHQWNRFYLLATVILSLIIPLVEFTYSHYQEEPNPAFQLLQVVQSADSYMEEEFIANRQSITAEQWIGFGYMLISLFIFMGTIISLAKVFLIISRHKVQLINKIKFISTYEKGTPFSFFRYIFWNENIDIHSNTGQQIFKHELVHVKEGHSFDKLFLQFILTIFWSNPFFWFIRRELQIIHEFIADKNAVREHDTSTLAAMILQAAYPHQFSSIANQFFQSSIKRRIAMLTKIQNPRIQYLSRVLVLPLIACIILAFTFKTKEVHKPLDPKKAMTVVIDAGHGKMPNGQMNGARQGNIYEDDIVFELAKKIKELNTNPKLNIVFTRTSENIVDLHKRVDIAKENKADLFISLHINAGPVNSKNTSSEPGSLNGFEISVSNKNTSFQKQSEILGSIMQQELNQVYPTAPSLVKHQFGGIWILDKNICPSILIECGYITNQRDREYITNEENQKAIADKILSAIEKYSSSPGEIDGIQQDSLWKRQ